MIWPHGAILARGLTAALLVAIASTSLAKEWVVRTDGSGDFTTFEAALLAAASGDTIVIDGVVPGERAEATGKSLHVRGENGGTLEGLTCILGEQESVSLSSLVLRGTQFAIHTAEVVSLVDVTVERNVDDPIRMSSVAKVRIQSCRFRECTMSFPEPAALSVAGVGDFEMADCWFEDNVAATNGSPWDTDPHGGGAVECTFVTGSVERCVFRRNQAVSGSAIFFQECTVAFRNNTVIDNIDDGGGGAVVMNSIDDNTTVYDNVFARNAGYGYWASGHGTYTQRVYCNAFWDNHGLPDFLGHEGQWWGLALGRESFEDYYGVFSDPLFCEDGINVRPGSPIGPGATHESCTSLMGAGQIGCPVDPVVRRSWGSIKAGYSSGRK